MVYALRGAVQLRALKAGRSDGYNECMCGIAGVFHFKNAQRVTEAVVGAMRDTLVHRGPDEGGTYRTSDGMLGLGNRRLKILDLSRAGAMPMHDAERKLWITYNGEIYNFRELRKELEGRGHRFISTGDTEVILASYREYGFSCVNRLNGMFAFALWDEERKRLFCARDHLGVKPFYYAIRKGTLFFGSEAKAILAHPDFPKELNEEALPLYLTFSSVPAPETLFRGVKKLPAAHTLTISAGGEPEIREYWNPLMGSPVKDGEAFFVRETLNLLTDSIRGQMVSDVPFGCFLSGGIDSSTNAALMTKALGRPVETFSVGASATDQYNEFEYSRLMGRRLGSKVHERFIGDQDVLSFLDAYPKYADDPVGDPVCIPLFWLSELTRRSGVTVIQVGEGADELFAGYDAYRRAAALPRSWEKLARLRSGESRARIRAEVLASHPEPEYWERILLSRTFTGK
ncbi:MAG: asparagine synthase (glutamine-hydrolyzing), partial [Patescibacteria group bacterium]